MLNTTPNRRKKQATASTGKQNSDTGSLSESFVNKQTSEPIKLVFTTPVSPNENDKENGSFFNPLSTSTGPSIIESITKTFGAGLGENIYDVDFENEEDFRAAQYHDGHDNKISTQSKHVKNSFEDMAETATKEVEEDIKETKCALLYVMNCDEVFHASEAKAHKVIVEFTEQQETLKYIMGKKWMNNQLSAEKVPDSGDATKELFVGITNVIEWKDSLSAVIHLNNEQINNVDEDNSTTLIQDKTKEMLNRSVDTTETMIKVLNNASGNNDQSSVVLLEQLESELRILNNMREQNQKNKFHICILGLEKSGKTTFINALLCMDLLPTAEIRCTQVVTILRPAEVLSGEVEFVSMDEFNKKIDEALKRINAKSDEREREVLKYELEKAKNTCSMYIGKPKTYVSEDRIISELRKFVADPELVYVVKQVVVYTPNLPKIASDYELHDVPGFDSPEISHRKAAIEEIKNCDAFLFLQSSMKPSLTHAELDVITEMKTSQFDVMRKAFGVITMLDRCHTRDEYLKRLQETKSSLLQAGFFNYNIFEICSKIPLLTRTNSDCDELKELIKKATNFNDDEGISLLQGFDNCFENLKDFVSVDLPKNRWVQPAVTKAIEYKNECFITNRDSTQSEIKSKFMEKFNKEFNFCDFRVQSFKMAMIQNDTRLQMDHRPIEDKAREAKVELFLAILDRVSIYLAQYLYGEYIIKTEKILNENLCKEDPTLFKTSITENDFYIEIRTLIFRVGWPLVTAILRWARECKKQRKSAVFELAKVNPLATFRLCSKSIPEEHKIPSFQKLVVKSLGWAKFLGIGGGLPAAFENFLSILD